MAALTLAVLLAGAPEKHHLRAVEGKQCQLRAASEVAKEQQRLGTHALDVWVAYALEAKLLPAPCLPKKPFGPRPKQACEACGCPETWYFCARSAENLSKFGYSVVE